jgi:tetrahydromethanopterin S-methyltransferase subunit G
MAGRGHGYTFWDKLRDMKVHAEYIKKYDIHNIEKRLSDLEKKIDDIFKKYIK